MAEHILKTWPNNFEAISKGTKRFEWRQDDRGYEVGDTLVLKRYDPSRHMGAFVNYNDDSPANTIRVRVTYILRGQLNIPSNYCCMSIEPIEPTESRSKGIPAVDYIEKEPPRNLIGSALEVLSGQSEIGDAPERMGVAVRYVAYALLAVVQQLEKR
jgi:hypothetical protein